MKSPADLKLKLKRQWEVAAHREARLLGGENGWPIVVSIGQPSPQLMASDLDAVRRHVDLWRSVKVGEVEWEEIGYRATSAPVELPVRWKLRQPTEWIEACADRSICFEFEAMSVFAQQADPLFHTLLVRQRSLWRGKAIGEVVQAARLAMALEPGCATEMPLRTLSVEGIDTKFFERNGRLVTALLDARYDGEVSRIGLETFLGAYTEGENWLLVLDLDGTLLPFRKLRIRSSELRDTPLPGERLLIVENEHCQHRIPDIPSTIAVLGTGFDLSWTQGHWLQEKQIGYWGDIDTWGLKFLAKARLALPHLNAVKMSTEVYEQYAEAAVIEPVNAGTDFPTGLNESEKALYQRLLEEPKGRLEQEFLPENFIREALVSWANP